MVYDVDYFIKKFQAIPEGKWAERFFDIDDKYCANGHCGMREANCDETHEAIALAAILSPLKKDHWETFGGDPIYEVTANINDGETLEYPQPTPKQRILAALHDIKAMQQPKPEVKDIDTGGKTKTV